MRRHFASIIAALVIIPAQAADFDTAAYCRTVSEAVGGSYQIELTCREQEASARNRIQRTTIPDRVYTYCTRGAQAIGGSYQILESCIEQELKAKGTM